MPVRMAFGFCKGRCFSVPNIWLATEFREEAPADCWALPPIAGATFASIWRSTFAGLVK